MPDQLLADPTEQCFALRPHSLSHFNSALWTPWRAIIVSYVQRLTRQERIVLCVVLGLFLLGLTVKTYRAAHPPAAPVEVAQP